MQKQHTYNPADIESKWQKRWAREKIYEAPGAVAGKDNYMLLTEFPYPSGNLHMGHWYTFALADVRARYLRMRGHNVMFPIGFDAFGLPAENAAIKHDTTPQAWTDHNIAYMTEQLESMGASFDWSRVLSTTDPDYYRWTQWLFLRLYEKGLAYRAKTLVNWCPTDKTVLANEQVVDGCCERCGSPVEQKELTQWMLRITDYADRLIDDLADLDWPETAKLAQINWIGRSEGALIRFIVEGGGESIEVFTTRVDTLAGCTYVVLAPEHPLVTTITTDENLDRVAAYVEATRKKSELERTQLEKDKTGVFTGAYAVNPMNGKKVPVWVADYVLGHYGTGAVMAVPAHDERDFVFAKKYELPIKKVVVPQPVSVGVYAVGGAVGQSNPITRIESDCFTGDGELVDSGEFSGLLSAEARRKIVEDLREKRAAAFKTNYRLHDWVLSRQRYWGCPIPVVKCVQCGYVPVPDGDLPVELPKLEDFKPTDDGRSPLAKAEKWLHVSCPTCGGDAERETDTMDTFVDSSWYYLRYVDSKNQKTFAAAEKLTAWLPVPMYIGGAEHNTMHLLYARFFAKALYDLGLVPFSEPFTARRNHGVILGPDGQKMSKSRGNVVDPDAEVEKFGSDTVRVHLAFMGPYDQSAPWDPKGITGAHRFMKRVWRLVTAGAATPAETSSRTIDSVFSLAVKKVGEDIDALAFNTAVSELMKLLNTAEAYVDREQALTAWHLETFLKLLAPLAPHVAEELWREVLGRETSIHAESWPEYDPTLLIQDELTLPVQVDGRVRGTITIPSDAEQGEIEAAARGAAGVERHLAGVTVRQVIIIPGRMVNIVTKR